MCRNLKVHLKEFSFILASAAVLVHVAEQATSTRIPFEATLNLSYLLDSSGLTCRNAEHSRLQMKSMGSMVTQHFWS